MAFSNTLSGRMEELRYPNLRSPESENSFPSNTSNSREQPSLFSGFPPTSTDTRGSLQRRFTMDSSKTSSARPMGQQYNGVNGVNHTVLKNRQMYDDIQSAKRKAEEQLRLLELQERSLQMGGQNQDLDHISGRLNRASLNGPVSEPTTPPEYAESAFSNRFSRSSRLSMNSIISPPGLTKRTSQTSSQITSPPTSRLSGSMYNQPQKQPAKSMPGSRRGSDEDEYYPEDLPTTRSAATLNRFSMPINSGRNHQRFSVGPLPATNSMGPMNMTSFLFEDDDDKHLSLQGIDLNSPVAKAFAQLEGDDTFPTLTSDGLKLSANSAALDLANSRAPEADWTLGSRYRPAHQSMPHTDSSMYRPVLSNLSSPPTDLPRRKSQRHSVGVTFEESAKYDQTTLPTSMPISRPSSLQTSYSTNDVPTVKKILTLDSVGNLKSQAEQQFHNHNVSMGRIPANAVNNRQSREGANGGVGFKLDDKLGVAAQSNLQASAAPFGPTFTSTAEPNVITSPISASGFAAPQTYAYNMQTYNISQMNPSNGLNQGAMSFGNQGQAMYGMTNGYNYAKGNENATRTGPGRRNNDEARFNNVPLESYRGGLYELCKDQHGCRYLQRKLEDGDADHIQAIFVETCPHIIELMTDPFGNYLCQKLFEHCNDDQRTALINTAAPALNVVALNQHGTRALQKMIEFVHTPEQVETIIHALSERVVELVQDLNGNHVVQKCLTRLGAERSQFIYDAVGKFCVVVGTHRHGCCVLQRCIDHAQGFQRAQLISRITTCAFDLVQDPFGNYVVQYILDLDEPAFTTPLCQSFAGRIVALSKQKFSSNVIEKCLRTADTDTKRMMIEEMMMGNELEKMLRDSFANYVVQTAMEFADPQTKNNLVETIRPILPSIKQTPHGRRIASKIVGGVESQGRISGTSSGQMTPNEGFPSNNFPAGRTGGRRQIQIVGGGFNGPRYANGYGSGDSADNNFSNGNNYPGMANMGGDLNESPINMFSPQGFHPNPNQNGFTGFTNGQVGNGFI